MQMMKIFSLIRNSRLKTLKISTREPKPLEVLNPIRLLETAKVFGIIKTK